MGELTADAGERQRARWQTKLLPLMGAMLVIAAVFFAAMSVVELRTLYTRLEQPVTNIDARLAPFEQAAAPGTLSTMEYLRFKTLAALEAEALQRRYHQATATMLARVWTRQLGFITGMLLALVGAAFILGRLSESPTKLAGEGQGFKAALETSSPGLVLAVLGTLLMALTIWIPFGVETRDLNIYLQQGTVAMPPPSSNLPQTNGQQSPPSTEDVRRQEERLFDKR